MNDYTGKICPFCKTKFKPDDEIIVCSECDMPHHKSCWIENQGCTTFGCLGTIKTADNIATHVTPQQMNCNDTRAESAAAVVYCTRCGTPNQKSSSLCSECGNRLTTFAPTAQTLFYTQSNPMNSNAYAYVNQQNTAYQQQNSYFYAGYNTYQGANIDTVLQQLVGTKTEYYIPKFQELKARNTQASWNWPAFLVTPCWMIYLKMYGYGATVLAISFVLSLIGSGFLSLLLFGGYIAVGIFANNIYMKFLEGKAAQAKSIREPFRTQFIVQNSGVNTTATVLTIVGYVLLMIILFV